MFPIVFSFFFFGGVDGVRGRSEGPVSLASRGRPSSSEQNQRTYSSGSASASSPSASRSLVGGPQVGPVPPCCCCTVVKSLRLPLCSHTRNPPCVPASFQFWVAQQFWWRHKQRTLESTGPSPFSWSILSLQTVCGVETTCLCFLSCSLCMFLSQSLQRPIRSSTGPSFSSGAMQNTRSRSVGPSRRPMFAFLSSFVSLWVLCQ